MEKKRKHPNFIDIAFLLLIAAVALAAYFISHQDSEAVNQTTMRSYVVELSDLDPSMSEYVAVGDAVTDNVKNYALGTVTAVEVVPYTMDVMDEEAGVYREAEVPNRISLQITIEAATLETDKQITTDSGYVLQVGGAISCTAGVLSGPGHIIALDR